MSLQAGIVYGYTGVVIHIIEMLQKELGYRPKVLQPAGWRG